MFLIGARLEGLGHEKMAPHGPHGGEDGLINDAALFELPYHTGALARKIREISVLSATLWCHEASDTNEETAGQTPPGVTGLSDFGEDAPCLDAFRVQKCLYTV